MAQQQNITIAAPAFFGLNTQDSPITQSPNFAKVAEHAVVDRYGRIGARKAMALSSTTIPNETPPAGQTYEYIINVTQRVNVNGTWWILCAGQRNEIADADGSVTSVVSQMYRYDLNTNTLALMTVPAVNDSITLSRATLVPFNDKAYVMSSTNEMLVFDGTLTLKLISTEAGYIGIDNTTAPTPTGGVGAYGRLWYFGHGGDDQTLYYSDLLIAASAYDPGGIDPLSTAGKIDVREYWPQGQDSIVSVAAHNNLLIIFGRQSVLLWGNPQGDPAAVGGIYLADTVANIGCIAEGSVVNTGNDVLFLDDTGVRSLGRTIQEQSAPIGDITKNVRDDVRELIRSTVDPRTIRMTYAPDESFVLLIFGEKNMVFCLDMRSPLEDGAARVTTWPGVMVNDASFLESGSEEGTLFFGSSVGVGILKYDDTYLEYTGSPYLFRYYSHPLTFGDPARLKFVKQADFTVVSSLTDTNGFIKWAQNYSDAYKSRQIVITAGQADYWGDGEFNNASYLESDARIKRYKVNTTGSGEAISVGLEVEIDGTAASLQEINIQALLGRII